MITAATLKEIFSWEKRVVCKSGKHINSSSSLYCGTEIDVNEGCFEMKAKEKKVYFMKCCSDNHFYLAVKCPRCGQLVEVCNLNDNSLPDFLKDIIAEKTPKRDKCKYVLTHS